MSSSLGLNLKDLFVEPSSHSHSARGTRDSRALTDQWMSEVAVDALKSSSPPSRMRATSKEESSLHVRKRSSSVSQIDRSAASFFSLKAEEELELAPLLPLSEKEEKSSLIKVLKRSENERSTSAASSSAPESVEKAISLPKKKILRRNTNLASLKDFFSSPPPAKEETKKPEKVIPRRRTDLTSQKEAKLTKRTLSSKKKSSPQLKKIPDELNPVFLARLEEIEKVEKQFPEEHVVRFAQEYLKAQKTPIDATRANKRRGEQIGREASLLAALQEDFILSGKVMSKAAEILLKNSGKVTPIQGGSGGVYLISNHAGKKLFVFKPQNESPGLPHNPKGIVHIDPTDTEGSYYGFEVGGGIYRDYGASLFSSFSEGAHEELLSLLHIKKTICTLALDPTCPPQTGLLMEYIDHICDLDQFQLAIHELISKKSEGEATEKILQKYPASFAQLLKSYVKAITQIVPLNRMGIWNRISALSVHRIIVEDLRIPNADCNAGNLLIVPRYKPTEIRYDVVRIDNEQTYPAAWVRFNPPAWYNTVHGEGIIEEIPLLAEAIKTFDAMKDFELLYSQGLRFGEEALKITLAWHCAAQAALKVKATINQLGYLLFEPGAKGCTRLYDVYLEGRNPPSAAKTNFWEVFKDRVAAKLLHKMKLDFKNK